MQLNDTAIEMFNLATANKAVLEERLANLRAGHGEDNWVAMSEHGWVIVLIDGQYMLRPVGNDFPVGYVNGELHSKVDAIARRWNARLDDAKKKAGIEVKVVSTEVALLRNLRAAQEVIDMMTPFIPKA